MFEGLGNIYQSWMILRLPEQNIFLPPKLGWCKRLNAPFETRSICHDSLSLVDQVNVNIGARGVVRWMATSTKNGMLTSFAEKIVILPTKPSRESGL